MKIDLARAGALPDRGSDLLQAQVCVVGGGIAGLLLADALTRAGHTVLLLEGGGVVPEAAMQRLAGQVELTGQAHRGSSEGRTWAVGGSSITWGGQLLPLEDDTPWPLEPKALRPYFEEIERLLGVDDLPYGAQAFWAARQLSIPALPGLREGVVSRLSKFAPFGKRNLASSLGARLRAHPRAGVAPHGRVVRLHWNAAGDRVSAVNVQLPSGEQRRIQTGLCVLAAGTVETCRLLLASAHSLPHAQRPWAARVGLNFHDHLTVTAAVASGNARAKVLEAARPWLQGGLRGTSHVLKMEAAAELRERLHLNPVMAHWTFTEPEGSGVAALRNTLRARQQGRSLWSIAAQLPEATHDLWRLHREAKRCGRRFVSAQAEVALRLNVAQRLPSLSSVRLGEDLDAMGQRRARVHWKLAADDLRTLGAFAVHLRQVLAGAGIGESEGLAWRPEVLRLADAATGGCEHLCELPDGLEDARHAMGGACMGKDPQGSVVSSSLRVHGVKNLYVASAAVFPDGSAQLPTLTLMALTLRLAEHLRRELAQ